MGKNLGNLIRTDIFNAFREGVDKHSIKAQGGGDGVIFSYAQRNQLLDVSKQLSAYIKAEYPEVRKPSQLTAYHAEAWLSHKASAGCSQDTLDTYRSALGKLGSVISARERVDVDLRCDKVTASPAKHSPRGAQAVISGQDYAKLLDYCKESKSGSAVAVRLERLIGVRVSDMAYGVTIDSKALKIDSKGGKACMRPLTPQIRALLAEPYVRSLIKGNRLELPKDNSINKFLSRTCDKLGIERHSFHDLRRYCAQEKYDEFRRGGMTRQQALGAVGAWLNHGEHREKLVLESYVANAW